MTDIAAFIEARLSEWTEAAEAASEVWCGPFDDGPAFKPSWSLTAHRTVIISGDKWTCSDDHVCNTDDSVAKAEHIVIHDPAQVLRQVKAMRRILVLHYPNKNDDCIVCGWDDGYEDVPNESYPCATLRAVASQWSDHPDYQKEWA